MKVQGNDISHKLQISRVSKNDEGLYECRVTRANYGEIVEYKAQAWLKVNSTARPRRPLPPAKKSSPLHLTDKKPRKSTSPLSQDNMSSDQRVASTSTSHTSSNTVKHNPGSGKNFVKTSLVGTESWSNPTTFCILWPNRVGQQSILNFCVESHPWLAYYIKHFYRIHRHLFWGIFLHWLDRRQQHYFCSLSHKKFLSLHCNSKPPLSFNLPFNRLKRWCSFPM